MYKDNKGITRRLWVLIFVGECLVEEWGISIAGNSIAEHISKTLNLVAF